MRSILRACNDSGATMIGEKKSVRFALNECRTQSASQCTTEQRQAELHARQERHERARLEGKQQMAAVALEMHRGTHQRIGEAVQRALTEPQFRLLLRVALEDDEECLVQYRPRDYTVAVRLLRSLELLRRCGQSSEQLARQHARLVEACLAPHMQSSRQIFAKLCECEEVGEFVLPLSSDGCDSAALGQLSLRDHGETYTQRCTTYC
jgi:hypothetical protein